MPDVLLRMIRKYFPRKNADGTGPVKYPPPFTEEGGCGNPDGTTYPYPLEFVNLVGESCEKEKEAFPSAQCYEDHSGPATDYPSYLKAGHGSPHYCSKGAKEADVYNDWCPYVFFGPNRGQYRHPHIAYAVVETFLANKVMPTKCGKTWDDNDGADYPYKPNDNSVAFPAMAKVKKFSNDPEQPKLRKDGSFIWPGPEGVKRKAVPGDFVIEKYLTPTTIGKPVKEPVCCVNDKNFRKDAQRLKGCGQFLKKKREEKCKLIIDGKPVADSCPVQCKEECKKGPKP